jgi:hypothetical protein
VTTTWNPLDNSTATLSNGNLTATFKTALNTYNSIRSTNSPAHASGRFHAECTATQSLANGGWLFGFGDPLADLTGFAGTTGGDSIGALPNGGGNVFLVFFDGSSRGYPALYDVGDVIAAEVDIDRKLAWFANATKATGWTDGNDAFLGNPAAGTGGTAFAHADVTAGLMLMFSGFWDGSQNESGTLNTAGPFVAPVSVGFAPWDNPPATSLLQTRFIANLGRFMSRRG